MIVAGIALIDDNTRRFLTRAVHGDMEMGIALPDLRLHAMMRGVTDVVGRDHMQMAAFVLVGFVLFFLMFKT